MIPEHRDRLPPRSFVPPPAAYARLRAALAEEPPSSRWRGRLRRASLAALPLLALAALASDAVVRGRSLVRADAGDHARTWLPSVLAALVLALAVTALALARGRDGLGLRVTLLRATTASVAPLSVLPMLALARPERLDDLHPWGLPCLALASAVASAALAWLVAGLYRSVAVAVGWRCAALGSAASAWSALALLVHCPSHDVAHLALGHALPLLLFPALALLLRRALQL